MDSETILNSFESRTRTSCAHSITKINEKYFLRDKLVSLPQIQTLFSLNVDLWKSIKE